MFNVLKNPKVFYEKSYNISLILLVILSFVNFGLYAEKDDYPIAFIAEILFIINYLSFLFTNFLFFYQYPRLSLIKLI